MNHKELENIVKRMHTKKIVFVLPELEKSGEISSDKVIEINDKFQNTNNRKRVILNPI